MKIANFSFWLGLSIALLISPTIVWAEEIVDENNSTTTTSTVILSESPVGGDSEESLDDTSTSTPDTSTTTIDTTTSTVVIPSINEESPSSTPDTATTTTITPTSSPSSQEGDTDGTTTSTLDTATATIVNQTIPSEEINGAIQKILNYFKSQQSADGKIIDGNTTDWAIMSFGANGQYAEEIKNTTSSLLDYEKNYNLDDPSDLNSCASYPRHILALLSAGVSKNDAAMLGLKNKMLTVCYQNNLYGLHGINDDVFGLIALLALDTGPTEQIIQDIVSTTKSWQIDNGAFSWPDWDPNSTAKIAGDDITGAAVNALKYAQSKDVEIDNEIFAKAKTYLKSTQQTDGGWGWGTSDIMTTSWVLMGINALGESQNEWFNSTGKNPWHPLISQLKNDGYYESAWVPGTTDWFAMKHAVPALAGKFWPIILPEKITHFEVGPNVTYSSGGGSGSSYIPPVIIPTTTAPTTTLAEIATTTISTTTISTTTITTTTIADAALNNLSIQTISSTPINATPKIIIKKPTQAVVKIVAAEPEVKGEKISAEQPTVAPTEKTTDSPPKTKENILVKALNWILRLFKNLIY